MHAWSTRAYAKQECVGEWRLPQPGQMFRPANDLLEYMPYKSCRRKAHNDTSELQLLLLRLSNK